MSRWLNIVAHFVGGRMKNRKMYVGSLFSGIGAMDYGLQLAGMEIAWQVEIDEFCRKVLQKYWPEVPKYGDIREVKPDELEPVDLICGGFPCQPFSTAGKRRGTADDRYFWPEMFRVIKALRPRWVLGENVAGIVNLALDTVLSDLESEGYETATFIIPACAVNAPHRRDRVWVVAYAKCQGLEGCAIAEMGTTKEFAESGQNVAYTSCSRQYREAQSEVDGKADQGKSGCGFDDCRQDVAHAAGKRLEGGVDQARQVTGCNKGEIESRLGGIANGLACWMDLYNWPAPLGCEQYDWEPPRTILEKPSFWKERIQALGNAVIPLIPYVIGTAIREIDKCCKNKSEM
ncbi:MAG: (cytosine-5)-methyltransferase 1 [Candidatus Petromonas sp.]|nr:(cytosine-5)-methyltransferase 1 [Candidatus Petromonas sp.]